MFKYSLKLEHFKPANFFSYIKSIFSRIEWKIALKMGVTASISFLLGLSFSKLFDRPDVLISGLWSVVASIVVMQQNLGATYKAAWERFLGVLIGTLIGCAFTEWLGAGPLYLMISVTCTALICSLFNLKESIRLASLSVAVIMIYWGSRGEVDPWIFGIYRFIDSCLGILVAMFVASVLWPSQATQKLQNNISKILKSLNILFRDAVSLKIPPEPHKKGEALVEKDVSKLLRDSFPFTVEARLETLFGEKPTSEQWLFLLDSLESIFEAIMTLKNQPKEKLALMIDEPLMQRLNGFIENADASFEILSEDFSNGGNNDKATKIAAELVESIKALKEDLVRFRETRATRKFDLVDVESFYVFIYSLGYISEGLLKIIETRNT